MDNNNRAYQQVKYKAEDVIRDLTDKKDVSLHDLDALAKSICLIEKINAIEEGGNIDENSNQSERAMSGTYSNAYRSYNPMMRDEYDYAAEASYRRGRSPITGQYVSRDGGGSSRGSYADSSSSRRYYDGSSKNSGYSGHSMRDRAIAKLEGMYDEARTEHERQFLDECIKMIEYYR